MVIWEKHRSLYSVKLGIRTALAVCAAVLYIMKAIIIIIIIISPYICAIANML